MEHLEPASREPGRAKSSFKVFAGRDPTGRIVSRELAVKGTRYTAVCCGSDLIVRKGPKRRIHFAHSTKFPCSRETALHKCAKALIVQVISDWKTGVGPSPVVQTLCGDELGHPLHASLPGRIERAVEEYRIDRFVADVALLDAEGRPLAAVEVRVTHAVTDEKAKGLPVSWLELEAGDGREFTVGLEGRAPKSV